MWSMSRAGVAWMAAVLLAAASEASAQDGVLAGRVIDDSSGTAIGGAEVQLLAANERVLRTVTASDGGEFSFPIRRRGEYRLRATGRGFREVVTPKLRMNLRDSVGVEVRLRQGTVLLAPLVVVARPAGRRHLAPGLDNFRHRQQSSVGGRFITREQVLARQPVRLSDVLPQSGVVVSGSLVYFPRSQCSPMIYMDGVAMTRPQQGGVLSRGRVPMQGQSPYELINLISPGDVEGIEIYPGRASTPAEFGGPGAECGVIAIWTRRSEQAGGDA